jgi:hypothetical protein
VRKLAAIMCWLIRMLACDTSLWGDDVWLVDSTPVEPERRGRQFFKPLRQIIESVNDTFKGQLDLERHGGRTTPGVLARILQRIVALPAAIWHNDHASQPIMRSLIAYDH